MQRVGAGNTKLVVLKKQQTKEKLIMLQPQQILQERYQLQRQLGHNPNRQTWLAQDLETQPIQLVVVKLLAFSPQMQWEELKLFEREAQVLKHLNHPRIPRYRDYFSVDRQTGDGLPWFGLVQDYIPGESLQQLLNQGKHFTEAQVRQIATEVLKILIYLHELSPPVFHRDIKPSNLIWGKDNQINLVDFGAVQDRAKAEGVTFTVVGTSGYAPPEQLWGKAVPASDLYALGATLIHLLTRTPPSELVQDNLRIRFANQVNLNPSFTDWLEELTEPALEHRLSTARQALQTLPIGLSFVSKIEKIRHNSGSSDWIVVGVLGLFVVVSTAIALPSQLAKSRQGEAKNNLGSMNRSQQAYYLEYQEFSSSLKDLGASSDEANFTTSTANYEYSIRTTPLSAFHYAIPRKKGLKGYVGGVYIAPAPGQNKTEELLTISFICETKSPSMKRPADPIVRGNSLVCGPSTRSLYESEDKKDSPSQPATIDQAESDLGLSINSLNYATAGRYDQALLVAKTIDSSAFKEKVLGTIAPHLTTAQQYDQALLIAKTIQDASYKQSALSEIASALAEKGQFDQALALAESLKDEYKNPALSAIASELAEKGRYNKALEIAKTIQDDFYKKEALSAIAPHLTTAQQYVQALEIAQSIADDSHRQSALSAIARALATVGQYDKALQVAETIKDYYKEEALGAIACELADAGQYAQAQQFAQLIRDDSTNTRQKVLKAIARYKKSHLDSVRKQIHRFFIVV